MYHHHAHYIFNLCNHHACVAKIVQPSCTCSVNQYKNCNLHAPVLKIIVY